MLTIVLTLYNRPKFTPRFLEHVCRWNWRVLIADGSAIPQVTGSWGADYKYFGPDTTIERWHTKVYSALEMVDTPYVMLADNDDLPTHNLSHCIGMLEEAPYYICSSGCIQGFYMWPDLVNGPHSAVTHQYSPYDTPADYLQDDANERVLAGFANSWSYYAVYRTEVLRQIWKEVCALALTDLQVHEKFCAMRALTLGKAFCYPTITTLYRQYGTSQGGANYKRNEEGRRHDINKVLAFMGREGVSTVELTKRWERWYASRDAYLFNPRRKALKRAFPRLAWLYQNRHRYLPHKELAL